MSNNMSNVRKKLIEIIEEEGIGLDQNNSIIDIDSLRYISTILNIEEEFDIEVPDEMLNFENLNNLDSFVVLIEDKSIYI